ncbi:tRNA (guanine-N(1)-)-methyltransferase [Buchnera aphidicola (Anoecia corni)]|uniref:tRNA (guanine-N(1)-)-methyltransferase n=1 Tax=Buchnera aphidicola (Anoecia corni) TaxID=2994477 RepID=A0AAT9IGN2_9GAMM
MKIDIISIFPEMFSSISKYGILGKAIKKNLLTIDYFNPRHFSENKRKRIDSKPYGGGPGMVMMFQPLTSAINVSKKKSNNTTKVIYLSPKGTELNKKKALSLIKHSYITLVCGRYQGIDERILKTVVDEELSIGNYILSGGEIAAMVIIDVISRLIPGVVGNIDSINSDSFSNKLLEEPQYAKPKTILNMSVPKTLLSGHHKNIKEWKLKASLKETLLKKPNLLLKKKLSTKELKLLVLIKKKLHKNSF